MRYLFSFVLLAVLPASLATTYRELSLDELISRAELAFYGTVSEVQVEAREGEPYTVVTFNVEEGLEGEVGETRQLAFLGGTLPNGRTVEVEGMPEFSRGDEVLVFAYDAPYYSPVVGFSQGLWRVTPRGLEDLRGRMLSVNEAGRLQADGEGSSVQDVLRALRPRLEGDE